MTSDSESRVTRSRRSLGLAIALLAGGIVAVTGLSAQETPASAQPAPEAAQLPGSSGAQPPATVQPPTAAQAPGSSGGPTQPATQPQPADTKPPPAGAPTGGTGGRSQDHFEPTEKVRADFDVSFPVDI